MRVVYSIAARVASGGIGTIARHAARGLARNGMLDRLLCGSSGSADLPDDRILSLGIPSRVLTKLAVHDRSRRIELMYRQIFDRWAARNLQPCDIFYGWNGQCLSTLRRAKQTGALTFVERASSHPLHQIRLLEDEYHLWGLTFRFPDALLHQVMTELDEADFIVIPSDFVRETFRAQGSADEKLRQVSYGADLERFRPSGLRDPDAPFRVMFAGQVNVRKGVPYLLEAWKRLRWTNAELWLVGRMDPAIERLLRHYGRLRGLRLHPHVRAPQTLFREVDVFAFPTLEEGSALVVFEALASGIPVVTTRSAGSVVREGLEGFLIPTRDVDALADRLERLRSNVELRREMGRAARRRAEGFTWDRYGDELATLLSRHLLATPSPAVRS